jgi:hypothetical protein
MAMKIFFLHLSFCFYWLINIFRVRGGTCATTAIFHFAKGENLHFAWILKTIRKMQNMA